MATKALQELLLRRKELQEKVDQLKPIKGNLLADKHVVRMPVDQGYSDLNVTIPRVTMQDFTAEYDWYARQLREVDSHIQRANWETKIDNVDHLFEPWTYKEVPKTEVEKKKV